VWEIDLFREIISYGKQLPESREEFSLTPSLIKEETEFLRSLSEEVNHRRTAVLPLLKTEIADPEVIEWPV
jgi:hypothetical protein